MSAGHAWSEVETALSICGHIAAEKEPRLAAIPPQLRDETLEQLRRARYCLTKKVERLLEAETRLLRCGGFQS